MSSLLHCLLRRRTVRIMGYSLASFTFYLISSPPLSLAMRPWPRAAVVHQYYGHWASTGVIGDMLDMYGKVMSVTRCSDPALSSAGRMVVDILVRYNTHFGHVDTGESGPL